MLLNLCAQTINTSTDAHKMVCLQARYVSTWLNSLFRQITLLHDQIIPHAKLCVLSSRSGWDPFEKHITYVFEKYSFIFFYATIESYWAIWEWITIFCHLLFLIYLCFSTCKSKSVIPTCVQKHLCPFNKISILELFSNNTALVNRLHVNTFSSISILLYSSSISKRKC